MVNLHTFTGLPRHLPSWVAKLTAKLNHDNAVSGCANEDTVELALLFVALVMG